MPHSKLSFSSLHLAQPLLHALTDEGYTTPTPIQAQAIGPVLLGRDLLGCAQTGTGKTAAFALPILHRLLAAPADKARRGPAIPRVLILSPTRELASQIGESFATYGRYTGLTHTVIFGGVGQFRQVRALHRGVDILVATPGRLIDLMEQRITNFSAINILVLDEADRMLDMGFINPIRRIAAALPSPRQTLLFSATMPREIMHLADSLLRDPVKVAVAPQAATAALIEQSVYMVPRMKKQALLEHLLAEVNGSAPITRALVFTRTKHGADKVTRRLHAAGVTCAAIHGNKAQNQRERALAGFRTGHSRVLVATDVAARGLDVDGITHVINFDLPNEPEAYVHRIGRTGRAGATGIAISFCDGEERAFLRQIERLMGKTVPAVAKLPVLPESPHDAAGPRPAERAHTPHHGHAAPRPANAPHHGHSTARPAHAARPRPSGSHSGSGHASGGHSSGGRDSRRPDRGGSHASRRSRPGSRGRRR